MLVGSVDGIVEGGRSTVIMADGCLLFVGDQGMGFDELALPPVWLPGDIHWIVRQLRMPV